LFNHEPTINDATNRAIKNAQSKIVFNILVFLLFFTNLRINQ
jgi:hypothetical protein